MASGGVNNRKISAASARSHTRRHKQTSPSLLTSGMVKKLLLVSFMGLVAWAFQASRPPPPKICGSPDGPSVTASRVKLNDGRHLAYKEHGVSKDKAKYKIVYIHGFDNSRHDVFIAGASPDIIEGLGVYIVSFDRPGYGESDPDPKRTEKSLAFDIEDLADKLELGSKFYVVGFSMGAQVVWSCLKYIPHRVAGATLLAPLINFWWPGFPANLSTEVFNQQFPRDQWTYRVAHYLPSLTYWWNTQTWFPSSSVIARNPALLSSQDIEIIQKMPPNPYQGHSTQQGVYESIHRDLLMAFGTWEFDPMDLKNPFPNNEGSVHVWHGDEDRYVPIELQRYIAEKLPWITYHEIPGAGHLFPAVPGMSDAIVKSLLTGEK